MSVTISIEDDGRIESRHNSGRVLWERDVDVAAWGGADVPADLAVSEAVKLALDEIAEAVDSTSPDADDASGGEHDGRVE